MFDQKVLKLLRSGMLFYEMEVSEIGKALEELEAKIVTVRKDEFVFYQEEEPRFILVLLDGQVVVGRDSPDGRRSVMAKFSDPGDMFGEVYSFLRHPYDCFSIAEKDSMILEIPVGRFRTAPEGGYIGKVSFNLMRAFAAKAYYLNQRLQAVTGSTLRQKLAKTFLLPDFHDEDDLFKMKREQLADFVNAARPSVSREISAMQEDGLIEVVKGGIRIVDYDAMENLLP